MDKYIKDIYSKAVEEIAPGNGVFDDEEAIRIIKFFCETNKYKNDIFFQSLKSEIINKVLHQIKEINIISHFESKVVGNKPGEWFSQFSNDSSFEHYNRYNKYLRGEGYSEATLTRLRESVEDILSRCADPKNSTIKASSITKGLVVGQVQSGKTSNYLGLINMALDAGYTKIIILTGLTETLRVQTQKRVDEAVIGAESDSIGNICKYIGVGVSKKKYYSVPFTNKCNDFNNKTDILNSKPEDYVLPVIFVCKKHEKILNNLNSYIKKGENHEKNSLLIIDDEADNASLNTRGEENPTTINNLIRKLLKEYDVVSYVGYTATPFANILANPFLTESENALFPSDFIQLLEAPNSYFGASTIFDNNNDKHLKILSDFEIDKLPTVHKKDYVIKGLPSSLYDAIKMFIINSALLRLDANQMKHRTMMVNVSVYGAVNMQVYRKINEYISNLKTIFEQNISFENSKFLSIEEVEEFYDMFINDELYCNEKCNGKYTWDNIKFSILKELQMLEVELCISKEEPILYDDEKEKRVIVIGGFMLSRGLTLNGLMVSYYDRNTKTYDTLLQMCRWFGYRNNYEHLCVIYMTKSNKSRFKNASESLSDLKDQMERMNLEGGTALDFGFSIKESPDILNTKLMSTAVNKCKSSQIKDVYINYSGAVIETTRLKLDGSYNKKNIDEFKKFISNIDYSDCQPISNNFLFKNVSNIDILNFFENYKYPNENIKMNRQSIRKLLTNEFSDEHEKWENWDVIVSGGSSKKDYLEISSKIKVPVSKRTSDIVNNGVYPIVHVSGSNNRLLNPNDLFIGLDKEQSDFVEKLAQDNYGKSQLTEKPRKSNQATAKELLNVQRNPVIIFYVVDVKNDKEEYDDNINTLLNDERNSKILACSICIPGDKPKKARVRINMVKLHEDNIGFFEEEDIDD